MTTKKLANAVVTQPCFQDLYKKLQTGKSSNSKEDNTLLMDSNGVTHTLPWLYNMELNKLGDSLPPSIEPVTLHHFESVNLTEWG